MHRLIPSGYSDTGTVLEDLTGDDGALADAATNERAQAEARGISEYELVSQDAIRAMNCN